jgi:alpha-tubulin suppressor-like RCC1 family protein
VGVLKSVFALVVLSGCVEGGQILFPRALDGGGVLAARVTSMAGGYFHTCAIADGTLWCWGQNLGNAAGPMLPDQLTPARVGTETGWVFVAAGQNSTCALRDDGSVWCWGSNNWGQLGIGSMVGQSAPQRVTLGAPARQLSHTDSHVCVILTDDSLWCWGVNYEGQLGVDSAQFPGTARLTPTPVLPGVGWKNVGAGQGHTCAIRLDGSLWCWGRNDTGTVGIGTAGVNGGGNQVRQISRAGTDSDWVELQLTQESSCALKADHSLWCWGARFGLGHGQDTVPTQVGTDRDWKKLTIGVWNLCGLKQSGAVWCWGLNAESDLGLGDLAEHLAPAQVGTEAWSDVMLGRFHRCVTTPAGELYCNGKNSTGQLGIGTTSARELVPSRVVFQ